MIRRLASLVMVISGGAAVGWTASAAHLWPVAGLAALLGLWGMTTAAKPDVL